MKTNWTLIHSRLISFTKFFIFLCLTPLYKLVLYSSLSCFLHILITDLFAIGCMLAPHFRILSLWPLPFPKPVFFVVCAGSMAGLRGAAASLRMRKQWRKEGGGRKKRMKLEKWRRWGRERERKRGRGEADFFLENMIKKKIINLQPEMDHESATCAGWLCKL